MIRTEASGDVIDRLRQLQVNDRLPEEVRKTTQALVSRLTAPTRITLLGPEGSGKSTLRDVLVGMPLLPADQPLPTTKLSYGDSEGIKVTLSDRSVRSFAGLDLAAAIELSPVFVEVQAPLDTLKSFGILELVSDGTARELGAAIRWAAPRTDIALWVTTEFDAAEQSVWARAPDAMKDHGYLVLNKLDRVPPAERDARCAELRDLAAQSFRAFFAISAAPNVEGAGARGCGALVKALRRHVETANQADIDGALMMLSRYDPRERAERPQSRPRSRPVSRPVSRPQAEPLDAPNGTPAVSASEPPAPNPTPSLRLDQLAAGQARDAGPEGTDSSRAALERLRICAGDLLADWTHLGGPTPETVLDRCADTVGQIAEAMAPDDRLHDPVHQANDLIVLLQLERNATAATSAVTALLQIKRGLELALAA